jgi:hypothetical protein
VAQLDGKAGGRRMFAIWMVRQPGVRDSQSETQRTEQARFYVK